MKPQSLRCTNREENGELMQASEERWQRQRAGDPPVAAPPVFCDERALRWRNEEGRVRGGGDSTEGDEQKSVRGWTLDEHGRTERAGDRAGRVLGWGPADRGNRGSTLPSIKYFLVSPARVAPGLPQGVGRQATPTDA